MTHLCRLCPLPLYRRLRMTPRGSRATLSRARWRPPACNVPATVCYSTALAPLPPSTARFSWTHDIKRRSPVKPKKRLDWKTTRFLNSCLGYEGREKFEHEWSDDNKREGHGCFFKSIIGAAGFSEIHCQIKVIKEAEIMGKKAI